MLSLVPLRKFRCQICGQSVEFDPTKTYELALQHYTFIHGIDKQTAMWWAGKVASCAKIVNKPDMKWELDHKFEHCHDRDDIGTVDTGNLRSMDKKETHTQQYQQAGPSPFSGLHPGVNTKSSNLTMEQFAHDMAKAQWSERVFSDDLLRDILRRKE